MPELHLPWLEMAIVTPLVGALLGVPRARSGTCLAALADRHRNDVVLRRGCVARLRHAAAFEAHDRWDFISPLARRRRGGD